MEEEARVPGEQREEAAAGTVAVAAVPVAAARATRQECTTGEGDQIQEHDEKTSCGGDQIQKLKVTIGVNVKHAVSSGSCPLP